MNLSISICVYECRNKAKKYLIDKTRFFIRLGYQKLVHECSQQRYSKYPKGRKKLKYPSSWWVDKYNVVYPGNGILLSYKKE